MAGPNLTPHPLASVVVWLTKTLSIEREEWGIERESWRALNREALALLAEERRRNKYLKNRVIDLTAEFRSMMSGRTLAEERQNIDQVAA